MSAGTAYIWLEPQEYAPCGKQLSAIAPKLVFPPTLNLRGYGTFSLSRIEGDEAIYEGNELNTQGHQIRLADNGDFLGGLRNFAMFQDDDYVINFDKDGVAIEK